MTNILLTVCAVLLAAGLGLAMALFLRLRRSVAEYLTPGPNGEPSGLAMVVDAAAVMFARAITAQLKTTFMGMQSGDRRGEAAIQGDLAMDMAAQSPLGAVLNSFPAVKKSLRRNPGLLDFALQAIGNRLNAMPPVAPGGGSSSGNGRPKFNL